MHPINILLETKKKGAFLMAILSQMLTGVIRTTQAGASSLNSSGFICTALRNITDVLCPDSGPSPNPDFRERLMELIGNDVEFTTSFTTLSGILIAVEDDYAVLRETTSSNVLVPLAQIQAVANLS